MKKFIKSGLSVMFLVGILMVVSCKDDPAPPIPSKISFSVSSLMVNEADGVFEINVVLDKPAQEDLKVYYEISGTAQDEQSVTEETPPADFYILEDVSNYGEIIIPKGETSGDVRIELFSDFFLEDDETIEFTLTSSNSNLIEITADNTMEVTIEQEDGLLVLLSWDYSDVDLDLFLWGQNGGPDLELTSVFSALIDFDGPEGFFLPISLLDDGDYGLSCTYYEGTADPMNFEVDFIKIENGVDVSTTTKMGTYSLVNINVWDTANGTDPVLVQTFEKSGTDFLNFSEIETPVSGSRIISSELPPDVTRTTRVIKRK